MVLKHEKRQIVKESYPQFCLRIPTNRGDQFDKIKGMVDDLHVLLKKSQKEDEKTISKSEIIIEALELGLKALKKEIKGQ